VGSFGRSNPGAGAVDRRRKRRLRLAGAALAPVAAACLLVVVVPSLAVLRPSSVAARSAPHLGQTKAKALKVRSGRTYRVTLATKRSQRWLVVDDPYDPFEPGSCRGGCPQRAAGAASALVVATIQSRGGACVARATLQGPTFDAESGDVVERQLGRGLIVSGTTFTTAAVPTSSGRIYLGLRPDGSFRCSNGRYAVRLTVQPALAINTVGLAGSASAAQYSSQTRTLIIKQAICARKGRDLDHYERSLTAQIIAAKRRGLASRIAKLKAAINRAERKYRAMPCPPR
jgi:hypothetical protein